jgi:hypothetical protein
VRTVKLLEVLGRSIRVYPKLGMSSRRKLIPMLDRL